MGQSDMFFSSMPLLFSLVCAVADIETTAPEVKNLQELHLREDNVVRGALYGPRIARAFPLS
jgi:hypothetical protein